MSSPSSAPVRRRHLGVFSLSLLVALAFALFASAALADPPLRPGDDPIELEDPPPGEAGPPDLDNPEPPGYGTPEQAVEALAKQVFAEEHEVANLLTLLIPDERAAARRFYEANKERFQPAEITIENVTYNEAEDEAELLITLEGDGEMAAMPSIDVRAVKLKHGWLLSIQNLMDKVNAMEIALCLTGLAFSLFDVEGIEEGSSLADWADAVFVDLDDFRRDYPSYQPEDITIRIIDAARPDFVLIFEDADVEDNDRTPPGHWEMDADGNLTGPGVDDEEE